MSASNEQKPSSETGTPSSSATDSRLREIIQEHQATLFSEIHTDPALPVTYRRVIASAVAAGRKDVMVELDPAFQPRIDAMQARIRRSTGSASGAGIADPDRASEELLQQIQRLPHAQRPSNYDTLLALATIYGMRVHATDKGGSDLSVRLSNDPKTAALMTERAEGRPFIAIYGALHGGAVDEKQQGYLAAVDLDGALQLIHGADRVARIAISDEKPLDLAVPNYIYAAGSVSPADLQAPSVTPDLRAGACTLHRLPCR